MASALPTTRNACLYSPYCCWLKRRTSSSGRAILRAKAKILATSSQSARTVSDRPIFSEATKINSQCHNSTKLSRKGAKTQKKTQCLCGFAPLREKSNVRDAAVKLSDFHDLLALETSFAQELFDPRPAVEVNVATLAREAHLAHRRAPRPESRKRHDRLLSADFPHALQHRQRIADVIKQPDAEAHVKRRLRFVIEQIGLNKRAAIVEVLFPARPATQIDHHFGNVDADHFRRASASELERIHAVPATDVEKLSILDRFAMLDSKRIPLVHVFPEDLVQRIRKTRFAMGVNPLESISFAIPKRSLSLNLVVQI